MAKTSNASPAVAVEKVYGITFLTGAWCCHLKVHPGHHGGYASSEAATSSYKIHEQFQILLPVQPEMLQRI